MRSFFNLRSRKKHPAFVEFSTINSGTEEKNFVSVERSAGRPDRHGTGYRVYEDNLQHTLTRLHIKHQSFRILRIIIEGDSRPLCLHLGHRVLCKTGVASVSLAANASRVLSADSTICGVPVWEWNNSVSNRHGRCTCLGGHKLKIKGFDRPPPSSQSRRRERARHEGRSSHPEPTHCEERPSQPVPAAPVPQQVHFPPRSSARNSHGYARHTEYSGSTRHRRSSHSRHDHQGVTSSAYHGEAAVGPPTYNATDISTAFQAAEERYYGDGPPNWASNETLVESHERSEVIRPPIDQNPTHVPHDPILDVGQFPTLQQANSELVNPPDWSLAATLQPVNSNYNEDQSEGWSVISDDDTDIPPAVPDAPVSGQTEPPIDLPADKQLSVPPTMNMPGSYPDDDEWIEYGQRSAHAPVLQYGTASLLRGSTVGQDTGEHDTPPIGKHPSVDYLSHRPRRHGRKVSGSSQDGNSLLFSESETDNAPSDVEDGKHNTADVAQVTPSFKDPTPGRVFSSYFSFGNANHL